MATKGKTTKQTGTKNSSGRKASGTRKTSGTRGASAKSTASKTAGKRTAAKTGTQKRSGAKREAEKERTDPRLCYEIFLWAVLACSILLFISYLGIGGFVGQAVSSFCFGCFGFLAYLFPFVLFFMTAFLISNRHSHIAKIKAAAAGGLYLVACGIMELLLLGYTDGFSLIEYYQAGAKYHTGGGFVGGFFVNLFCPAVGVVGAGIMMVIMVIICVVLITQRSIFASMKHQGSRVYRSAREEQARRREQLMQRREYEKKNPEIFTLTPSLDSTGKKRGQDAVPVNFSVLDKEPRIANRVTGVTADTDLSGLPEVYQDEIKQVLPEKTQESLNIPVLDFPIQRGDMPLEPSGLEEKSPDLESDRGEPAIEGETGLLFHKKDSLCEDELIIKRGSPCENDLLTGEACLTPEAGFSKLDKPGNEAEEEETLPSNERKEGGEGTCRSPRKTKASREEIQQGIDTVEQEIEKSSASVTPRYEFPPLTLLKKPSRSRGGSTDGELRETAQKLQQILHTFGVNVKVTNVSCGPSVTRYELMPEMGVKVSRITNLADDIKLNLAAADIRIEAPIPGKAAVGIEVPNKETSGVLLRELLESEEFKNHPSKLCYAVGKDIAGKVIVSDIAKMPHLLIAGATGSGKSVFINTLIMSIIYKAKPEEVKMIMIDPKVVELSVYNGIPHLFIPVVTDPKKAAGALNWGVAEMTQRFNKFAEAGVRDLKGYNAKVEALKNIEDENKPEKLPQIVIIVDELADLMMVASGEVEDAICRLAQLARAAGIHLVIATQRPSVDVITGLIKANMPSRIAFSVSSGVDSRTILDMNGAEKLLGNGDMLFAPQTYKKPARIQGAYVSDGEVSEVVEFLKEKNTSTAYNEQMEAQIEQVQKSALAAGGGDVDELFADAGKFIIEKDKASIGMLQRWFKIGFNRAARIMDQLSEAGVVGPEEGTKPRKVLMSEEQFENYLEEN